MARVNTGLQGTGFVILAADDASCNFAEIEDLEEAKGYAGMRAAKGGQVIIIYAPIAIVRPKFDTEVTVTATATRIMRQLGGVTDDKEVKG